MLKFSVTNNKSLIDFCKRNKYFTKADKEQYNKLLQANEEKASLKEIAIIIWLCSDTENNGFDFDKDTTLHNIYCDLILEKINFCASYFGVKNINDVFEFYNTYEERVVFSFETFIGFVFEKQENFPDIEHLELIVDKDNNIVWKNTY